MTRSVLDVAVVGAGPAGLLATRRLAEAGADFRVFERHTDVGGIWDIDAPGSPMYETAHFISSRTLSGFPGFPMPEAYPDYPHHREILEYIRAYADHHDLRRHISFGTEVRRAARGDEGWQLELGDGEQVRARYLICANGVTWDPVEVTWPGDSTIEVRHSRDYRSPSELAGRRVLVVGAGNSGVDIACDAAFAADAAFISVRRGYHVIPKHVMGVPADVFAARGPKLPHLLERWVFEGLLRIVVGDLRRYGLPRPDHHVFETHPILNSQLLHYLAHGDCVAKPDVVRLDGDEVVFADGSRERIDLVITATGYRHSVPYLDPPLDTRSGSDLYLQVFPRTRDRIALLGFPEFASAAYATFDEAAELIVADATAPDGSPLRREMDELRRHHRPDLQGGRRYLNSPRHADYVDGGTYRAVLREVKRRIGLTQRRAGTVAAPVGTVA
ncbi:MAG: flavin-containing monooxygenase [Kineosporiaceae bacterium]